MTRAKIINNETGLEIEGKLLTPINGLYVDFQIDGSSRINSFRSSEWSVEVIKPRVEDLPKGLYQVTFFDGSELIEHAVTYRKTVNGIKNALNNANLKPEDLKVLQDYYEKGRLVRLVREPVIFEEAS